MPTIITPEILKDYIRNEKRHKLYKESVELHEEFMIHSDGLYPKKIIEERRPSEDEEVHKYRKLIYVPMTVEPFSRVFNSISKVRKSQDWSLKYDTEKIPASIVKEETLQQYCEYKFPFFTSVTKWMFDVCLKQYLTDPNAVVVIMPLNDEIKINKAIPSNVYLKPYPIIFNSEQVLDYVEGDYAIIYSTDKSIYKEGTTTKYDGEVYYVITSISIQRWEQTTGTTENPVKNIVLKWEYKHNQLSAPMFKVGGIFDKALDNTFFYKSRLNPMLPRLREAVREYSDMQAEVVQNIHSQRWEIQTIDCKNCKGVGKITSNYGGHVVCPSCKGSCKEPTGPYSKMAIHPAGVGEQNVPIPPAGFIQKDTAIVKIQDERIDKHIYKALGALNMEFLAQVPLSISGDAKMVDRDELNNFVHSIAEDIVGIMDKIYKWIADYRYQLLNEQQRVDLLPTINVPDKFDIFSIEYLMDEYTKARNVKINPLMVVKMEDEIITKRFGTDDESKNMLLAINKLDPFAGMNSDEKIINESSGFTTEEDMVISCNIVQFVRRAKFENPDFYTDPVKWDLEKQHELMQQYAQEKLKENSAAAKVAMMIPTPGAPVPVDPNNPNPPAPPAPPAK